MYLVFHTRKYEKLFIKLLSTHEQREVEDFERKIAEHPYLGDPLGTPFFREKKIDGKRVYFIINDMCEGIFMIRIGTKKDQKSAIKETRNQLQYYQEYIKQLCERARA
jgi:hypothetical protein